MLSQTKASLKILLAIEIVFIGLFYFIPRGMVSMYVLPLVYAWMPGTVALAFAARERLRLGVFSRPNRYFYLALISGAALGLLAFLGSMPFRDPATPPDISDNPVLWFVTFYVINLIVLTFFFLGEELYWRGFLWEKVKGYRLKAVWAIALLWSIWLAPRILASGGNELGPVFNLVWMTASNFALTPLLLYFRIRGKAIITAALFYASFQVAPLYLHMTFPSTLSPTPTYIFAGSSIVLLVLLGCCLGVYSKKFWSESSDYLHPNGSLK